jgi:hypothetical protein
MRYARPRATLDHQKEVRMSTTMHERPAEVPDARRASRQLLAREMWAGIAITSMWVAVAFASIFGPDFKSSSAGGDTTTIPSGVAIALFASIASWLVAKHGFRERDGE